MPVGPLADRLAQAPVDYLSRAFCGDSPLLLNGFQQLPPVVPAAHFLNAKVPDSCSCIAPPCSLLKVLPRTITLDTIGTIGIIADQTGMYCEFCARVPLVFEA